MFDLGWVRIYPSAPPIRTDENVAVMARWCNVYFVNACRIVDTIHEHLPIQRYGFVYGTLEDHAESGEERFTVEWDRHKDEVWYDILRSRGRTSLVEDWLSLGAKTAEEVRC